MSLTNLNMNAVSTESVTMIMVCISIDGREILLHALQNEDGAKGVLMSWMHVEPISVQALNETTFLVTYASSILPDEIGTAVEKIENWLGKPVVITCDEVTTTQLPQVIECAWHTTGVDSVVFNPKRDDMHSDSNQSVQSGYHHKAVSPAVLGASGATILNKIPCIPQFSVTEREKDTIQFEQWLHAISDARKNFNEQLVWAAINKSCVGDAADAICCLLPGTTLDDIIEKFKWAIWVCRVFWYFNARVLQNCAREKWDSPDICPPFRKGSKAIKQQQHLYAMTEEEGARHLKGLSVSWT